MTHTHAPAGASLLDWFTGGPGHQYMTLVHCMDSDWFWIGITVALDLAIATGYGLIALHWYRNQRTLSDGAPKQALGRMRNIFVFCGLCGYLFIPIKMFWPAWRLYDIFAAILAYLTLHYAWRARELKVIYSELGRSQKLQKELEDSLAESRRKSFFLNAISHDLRTPLNGLTLQADVAEMSLDANDPAALRHSLLEIKSQARAVAELLGSFLELGRLDWTRDEVRVNEFALAECLVGILEMHEASARQKGLYLRMDAPPNLLVRTDQVKVVRILNNLVANAVKFTERGGVTVRAGQSGNDVTFDVIDTGIGIAPEYHQALFQEFYQVQNHERDRKKGFGLGLSIARRLAEQLGGTLEVDSESGRGSRFHLTLPGAVAASIPGAAREAGTARGAQTAPAAR